LSAPALTDKDRSDIRIAAGSFDFLAVSFVRNAEDVEETRRLFRKAGGHGLIVAKIERTEALQGIDSIIEAADIIMVARGDLGVEMGYAELTGMQKQIIRRTRHRNKVVITATQMMESMINNPIPTRAEVSDVANAVMDGTDAVMLSAETAVGKYPVAVIAAMATFARLEARVGAGANEPQTRRPVPDCQRGHCNGSHVHGQPPRGDCNNCSDRVGRNDSLDVSHPVRHPHLCIYTA
jgi:pyruvate kinase